MSRIIVEKHGPFRVELEYEDDNDWDFSHYGTFCELPRSPHGRFDHSAQAHNDPKGEDFYIRNPNVWKKVDGYDGSPSWVRTQLDAQYGWFKVAEHPRHEVEWLIKEEGLTEREAWKRVLTRLNGIIEDLALGNLSAMLILVEVFFNDELVGDATLGGIEVDKFIGDDGAKELAREHGLIDEAMHEAQKKIEVICKTAMLADRPDGATNAA